MLFMGIDGGGSNLRVVITDAAMQIMASSQRGTANPSTIGHDAAAALIQDAMREVLAQINDPIKGAGIGIAGAAASHSADWLRDVVAAVLPETQIVPASDFEIALVGATGIRRGILLLAGTGSVAYGINEAGEELQVGGWGYLPGDEGSGYWIGMEALRLITHLEDGIQTGITSLSAKILASLDLATAKNLIPWLYNQPKPRTYETTQLATIVLQEAEVGDPFACNIIEQAAQHLYRLYATIRQRLQMDHPKIAFAGGLLQHPNPLSDQVRRLCGLSEHPVAKYAPVVGAALLAKQTFEA